jgi:transcriptional regulator with PAS, ATPase and Fis domain
MLKRKSVVRRKSLKKSLKKSRKKSLRKSRRKSRRKKKRSSIRRKISKDAGIAEKREFLLKKSEKVKSKIQQLLDLQDQYTIYKDKLKLLGLEDSGLLITEKIVNDQITLNKSRLHITQLLINDLIKLSDDKLSIFHSDGNMKYTNNQMNDFNTIADSEITEYNNTYKKIDEIYNKYTEDGFLTRYQWADDFVVPTDRVSDITGLQLKIPRSKTQLFKWDSEYRK